LNTKRRISFRGSFV
jgi:hypothetical protein